MISFPLEHIRDQLLKVFLLEGQLDTQISVKLLQPISDQCSITIPTENV